MGKVETRRRITQNEVFEVAKTLAREGILPTQAKVRQRLGSGGMHTIHNYLRQWKEQCFTANKDVPELQQDLALSTLEIDNLEKENRNFFKVKNELEQQIEKLSKELSSVKNKANKYQYQSEELQNALEIKDSEIKDMADKYNSCERLLQERGENIEIMLADKNQLIYDLRQEMQETHKQAVEEIREHNQKHHDTTVNHQVENINLQEQIKAVTKKYKNQEGQLLDLKTSNIQLKKLLQEKETIISKYITPEELENYARDNSK